MKITKWFREKKWKELDRNQWLMLILAGILILVISIPTEDKKAKESTTDSWRTEQNEQEKSRGETGAVEETSAGYAEKMENELQNALSEMDGVGKVSVFITVNDSGRDIVEKDHEISRKSAVETGENQTGNSNDYNDREETVYDSSDNPLITNEMVPQIEGVLVICEGAENTQVKRDIMDAVLALFQVETHKIKIVKMNVEAGTNA